MTLSQKNKRIVAALSVTLGIGLLAFSTWGFLKRYLATHNPRTAITQTVITRSTDKPNETPLEDACQSYKAAGHLPERIDLPSIGASGCIEQVGTDQHGAIAVPDNIYAAAWYVKSALPGQPGLSIIDGHISGHYNKNGIFQRLYTMGPGSSFTVELGSGRQLHYRVHDVRSVPLEQAAKALLMRNPAIKSQLNLITCDGRYDPKTKAYDRRVVVTAELVDTKAD